MKVGVIISWLPGKHQWAQELIQWPVASGQ
jgi:hypothetical protein